MRIDFARSSRFDENEKRLVEWLRRARALAGVAVVGGIAALAVTAGPPSVDTELASLRGAAVLSPAATPRHGSLMALEQGRG